MKYGLFVKHYTSTKWTTDNPSKDKVSYNMIQDTGTTSFGVGYSLDHKTPVLLSKLLCLWIFNP